MLDCIVSNVLHVYLSALPRICYILLYLCLAHCICICLSYTVSLQSASSCKDIPQGEFKPSSCGSEHPQCYREACGTRFIPVWKCVR